jgi:hypothetical protein
VYSAFGLSPKSERQNLKLANHILTTAAPVSDYLTVHTAEDFSTMLENSLGVPVAVTESHEGLIPAPVPKHRRTYTEIISDALEELNNQEAVALFKEAFGNSVKMGDFKEYKYRGAGIMAKELPLLPEMTALVQLSIYLAKQQNPKP